MKPLHARGTFAIATTILIATANAQVTSQVSLTPSGGQANGASEFGSISASGRFVAFHSVATNLAPQSFAFQVYLRDRWLDATETISVSSSGAPANRSSLEAMVSSDGRYVVFASAASNLVAGDTNGNWDVFVRDRMTATTECVSVTSAGVPGPGYNSHAWISGDGRYVAFSSSTPDLAPGDANTTGGSFVRDRILGITQRASITSTGAPCSGVRAEVSADGRFVVFESSSSQVVPGDFNMSSDIFLRDLQSGTTECLSVAAGNGSPASGSVPTMSADARHVAFESFSSSIVAGDTNFRKDVFVRDRHTGTSQLVSVSTGGAQGDDESRAPSISADGRYVAFASYATNLVANDTNDGPDVFVRDLHTGTTERVNVPTFGTQADHIVNYITDGLLQISADGTCVTFATASSDLVVGDTNAAMDVFVRDRSSPAAGGYCFGDGTSAPCPCGNAGSPAHGCASSIFASGALLDSTGTASVAADSLTLTTSSVSGSTSLYFQGNAVADLPFDDGKICVGGTVVRIGVKSVVGASSSNPSGVDQPISVKGGLPVLGGTRYYQTVYRNSDAGFCSPSTTNRSNGIAITWVP